MGGGRGEMREKKRTTDGEGDEGEEKDKAGGRGRGKLKTQEGQTASRGHHRRFIQITPRTSTGVFFSSRRLLLAMPLNPVGKLLARSSSTLSAIMSKIPSVILSLLFRS